MKFIIILLFTLMVSGSEQRDDNFYLQADCEIYDLKKDLLVSKPQFLCHFFSDGSWIGLKTRVKKMGLNSPTDQIIWEIKLNAHHELSLTKDMRILTLGSEEELAGNDKMRYDVLKIISIKGKELASWSFKEHHQEFQKILEQNGKILKSVPIVSSDYAGYREYTHVNSFKEIPPNDLYPGLPYLKPGNYIVGVNCTNLFFIFNSELTRIVKVINYSSADQMCGTHDAQVLESGKILHYVNHDSEVNPASRLELFNPQTNQPEWQWPDTKNSEFHNSARGSVQMLKNGNLLFTDNVTEPGSKAEIIEINSKGEIVDKWIMELIPNDTLYRARKLKLGRYLRNKF